MEEVKEPIARGVVLTCEGLEPTKLGVWVVSSNFTEFVWQKLQVSDMFIDNKMMAKILECVDKETTRTLLMKDLTQGGWTSEEAQAAIDDCVAKGILTECLVDCQDYGKGLIVVTGWMPNMAEKIRAFNSQVQVS